MTGIFRAFLIAAGLLASGYNSAETVAVDGAVEVTAAEFKYALENAPQDVKAALAEDNAAIYDFVAQLIQSKKLANAALTPDIESSDYLEAYFTSIGALKKLMVSRMRSEIVFPEFEALAKERYLTQKETRALVSEQRTASHILFLCRPGCDRDAQKAMATSTLSRITEGESFSELAREYSDDLASARDGGQLKTVFTVESSNVDKAFLNALFELQSEGDLSPVVESQFGYHVIRLDAIKPEYTRSFEETRPAIESELRREYVDAQMKIMLEGFLPSEALSIDGQEVEAIVTELISN